MKRNLLLKWVSSNIKRIVYTDNVYNTISDWNEWYKGFVPSFHNYKLNNGIEDVTRKVYSLKMGKHICEDLSSLTFNENVKINIDSNKEDMFIQGVGQSGGVLGKNNFWSTGTKAIEKMMALGTVAIEVYVKDIEVNANGVAITSPTASIGISFINAYDIIPLSYRNGVISEVAFVNEYIEDNKEFMEVRYHILENGQYVIYNKLLTNDNKNGIIEIENRGDIVDRFETGSDRPWFSVLTTSIGNNIWEDDTIPFGVSVLANALDNLEAIDLAYDNLVVDSLTGGRKVFYNKKLLKRDSQNNVIAPHDSKRISYQFYDDSVSGEVEDNKFIWEYNPNSQINLLNVGVQAHINLLSEMCGLGSNYYKFNNTSVNKTATEVLSENSTAYRNIRRMQLGIEQGIINLCKIILYIGNVFIGEDLDINADIDVEFDASFIQDKGSMREQDLKDVQAGILLPDEYREKYHKDLVRKDLKNQNKLVREDL